MEGKTPDRFDPSGTLMPEQLVVICDRLYCLLTGSPVTELAAGEAWYQPAYEHLADVLHYEGGINALMFNVHAAKYPVTRYMLFNLLGQTMDAADTTLPEINQVEAVPDCCAPDTLRFYRWGILNGKDAYGTLDGGESLTRGAAAAVLVRLIDPAQRLTTAPKQLELCRELLDVAPDTVLMTVSEKEIPAEVFMPYLVSTCSNYNHSHFGSMTLEMNGGTVWDEAVKALCQDVLAEARAKELGLEFTPVNTHYVDGYQGLTAKGQAWSDYHTALLKAVCATQDGESFSDGQLPVPVYAEVWDTLNFSDLFWKVASLPYWGGTW